MVVVVEGPFQELDHVIVSDISTMASSRPSWDVNLTVPRFTSRVGPKVVREVVSMAKREGVRWTWSERPCLRSPS